MKVCADQPLFDMRHAFFFSVISRRCLNADLANVMTCDGQPMDNSVFVLGQINLVPDHQHERMEGFSPREIKPGVYKSRRLKVS